MSSRKVKLVLVSFLALFLELVLIRWLPAHLFSLAFFSNIILIASFLGLGLGFFISRHKRDLFIFFPLILFVFIAITLFLRNVQIDIPIDAKTWIWSYYSANKIQGISLFELSITQLISLIFVLSSALFIPIGQKIGRLMKEFKPLKAYGLNVLGSLLGVVSFTLFVFLGLPAFAWFIIIGIIISFLSFKKPKFILNVVLLLVIVVAVGYIERNTIWSPYYSIKTQTSEDGSISVFVNQLFHQKAINFDADQYAKQKYMLPYSFFDPKKVLIVGSGTGNDVWAALEAGVEQIDAVEIDSTILKLGHPQNPYQSDKVEVFIDDARSFIHKASGVKKYDMVVYGTLDSHATLSMASSIRLDNYVYTLEALKETRELLTENGVIVLLFSVGNDWLAEKLLVLAREAFGYENAGYLTTDSYLFNLIIVAGPGLEAGVLPPIPSELTTNIPRDNWPYLYLRDHAIPKLYSFALLIIIVISSIAVLLFSPIKRFKINPAFFFLGVGFLLLETKSITTFSLLFGSTWLINAIVFSSVLVIIFLVNWLVMKTSLKDSKIFFGGLVLSLILLYFFPIVALLKFNLFVKIIVSGFLIALPIFFSSFVFSILIRQVKNINISLGSNLLGAVAGGFLEYSSMIWGLNALYILVLICYLVAWSSFYKKT